MNICPHCQGPLVKKQFGPPPKYCSTKCRVAASHLRAKADGRYAQWLQRQNSLAALERAARAKKPCPYCGVAMTNPRRVQCGDPDCKRQYDAARMRTFLATSEGRAWKAVQRARRKTVVEAGDSFDPVEIFERDGWRCGICKKKVGRTLKYPHPRSASLDHIIPVSDEGKHVRENVQCSHLRCNLRKKHLGPGQLLIAG